MARERMTTQGTFDEYIRREHLEIGRAIVELELRARGGGDEALGAVFGPMWRKLETHMATEETVLYPLLERDLSPDIARAGQQHDRIRGHFDDLAAGGRMEPSEWRRRLVLVKEEFQRH